MSNQKPRVALYLRSLLDTGIDTRMLNLSQGLVERGINVDLVLNTSKQKDFSRVPQGVKIVDLKEPKLLKSKKFDSTQIALIKKYFTEYKIYGGMPEFLATKQTEYLHSLYESLLYKDIIVRNKIWLIFFPVTYSQH